MTDAIIGRKQIWLKIKRWPDNTEDWVGGRTHEMYGMCRRPDGGFQVAGDKFILIGSDQRFIDSIIETLTPSFDPPALQDLRTRLASPRDDVMHEW